MLWKEGLGQQLFLALISSGLVCLPEPQKWLVLTLA